MLVTGRAARAWRWWHAPAHHGQLAARVGVADHRRRVFGKHARHSCEVADIAIDDAEERKDGGLIGRNGIQIAHQAAVTSLHPR